MSVRIVQQCYATVDKNSYKPEARSNNAAVIKNYGEQEAQHLYLFILYLFILDHVH